MLFDEKILTNGVDVSEIENVMQALSKKEYSRVKFERLKLHPDIFSVRVDGKWRVLLSHVTISGRRYLVVVEQLKNHQYHRSTWLNHDKKLDPDSEILLQQIDEQFESFNIEENAELQELFERYEPELKKAVYIQDKYISLTESQLAVEQELPPLFISGLPGSGKTILLLHALQNFFIKNPLYDNKKNRDKSNCFYITESELLAETLADAWYSAAGVDPDGDRLQFLSYAEYAEMQDPSLANKNKIGIAEFREWLSKKKHPELNADWVYRDFHFACVKKTFAEYRNTGSRKLYYQSESEMKLIWSLFRDYQQYCKEINVCDLKFTEFPISISADLVCIDEGQSLSPVELIQATRSAKNQQYYVAMDTQQALLLNVSMRDTFLQNLTEQNHHRPPKQMVLQANHRMSHSGLRVVRQVVDIKNHLGGGVTDKNERYALSEQQENKTIGHVQFIEKMNPDLQQSDFTEQQWEQLRLLAHLPDAAFIVSTEAMRKNLKEVLGVGQIFLVTEISGLEWKYLIAIDLVSTPELDAIFKEMNEHLPSKTEELNVKENRCKSKENAPRKPYNPVLARLLIAYSRSTSDLIIIETKNHKKRNLISLLQEATLSEQAHAPTYMPQKVTEEMWQRQVKQLIKNGYYSQARSVMRDELKINVENEVAPEQLKKMMGIPLTKRRPKKAGNPKPKPVVTQSATASQVKKIAEPIVSVGLSTIRALLQKTAVTEDDVMEFKLEYLFEAEVMIAIIKSLDKGYSLLGVIFKKHQYFDDTPELENIFGANNNNEYPTVAYWMLQNSIGCKVLIDIIRNCNTVMTQVALLTEFTYNSYQLNIRIRNRFLEKMLWQYADKHKITPWINQYIEKMYSNMVGLQEIYQAKFMGLVKKTMHFGMAKETMAQEFNQFFKSIFTCPDFEELFFIGTDKRPPVFHLVLYHDAVVMVLIEYLRDNLEHSSKFSKYFNLEYVYERKYDLTTKGISPFKGLPITNTCLYEHMNMPGKIFLIREMSNARSCRLIYASEFLQKIKLYEKKDPLFNPIFWQAFMMSNGAGSHFITLLQSQSNTVLQQFFSLDFSGFNLKKRLLEGVGEYLAKSWSDFPEDPDMLDLLCLNIMGVNFIRNYLVYSRQVWFRELVIKKIMKEILAFHQNEGFHFLGRIAGYDVGLLIYFNVLQTHQQSILSAFTVAYELLEQKFLHHPQFSTLQNLCKLAQQTTQVRQLTAERVSNNSQCDIRFQSLLTITGIYFSYANKNRHLIATEMTNASDRQWLQTALSERHRFSYELFYYPAPGVGYMNTLVKPESIQSLSFVLNTLIEFPNLICYQNLPISLAICYPYTNSLFCSWMHSTVGRLLFGYLLRIHAFSLESIDNTAMIISLEFNEVNHNDDGSVSLLFALAVTAGRRGHEHLLKLIMVNNQLLDIIPEKELMMIDRCPVYPSNPKDTPLIKLQETEPGKKVLRNWLKAYKESHNNASPSFWNQQLETTVCEPEALFLTNMNK